MKNKVFGIFAVLIALSFIGCEQPTNTPVVTLTGITAVYNQTATIYPTTPLDDLKAGLTVKAQYSDSSENNLSAGEYALSGTLTVGSSTVTVTYEGKTTTFDVTVTADNIANKVPTANAGGNKSVQLSPTASVTLDGSGADEDGTIASYAWTCTSKPNGAAAPTFSSTAPNPAVSGFDTVGDYEFQLKVTDNEGAVSAPASVKVTVTAPPHPDSNDIVISGATPNGNGEYKYSDSLTLGGNAAVAGHTYAWSVTPDTLTFDKTLPAPQVSGFAKGITYTFNLAITNEHGLTVNEPATVKIAGNVAPTASIQQANFEHNIATQGSSFTLNGGGADTDGNIASYHWECTNKPSSAVVPTFSSNNSAAANNVTIGGFNTLGNYTFALKTKDNDGAESVASTVTVSLVRTASANITIPAKTFVSGTTDLDFSVNYGSIDPVFASRITYTISDGTNIIGNTSDNPAFSGKVLPENKYDSLEITFTQTFYYDGVAISGKNRSVTASASAGQFIYFIGDNAASDYMSATIPALSIPLSEKVSEGNIP
jgi:hypothetical protein